MMLAAVALSACENTPDNIRSNKHSAEVDSGEAYVSSERLFMTALMLHLKKSIQNSSYPKNRR